MRNRYKSYPPYEGDEPYLYFPRLRTSPCGLPIFRNAGSVRSVGAFLAADASVLQPDGLRSLAGLEKLELKEFEITNAFDLEDISALFALQRLTEISLKATAVDSLQGVQNLYELRRLDISHTSVKDLSELRGLSNLESVTVSEEMLQAIASLEGQEYSFKLEIEG